MSINISPRERFRTNADAVQVFSNMAHHATMQAAIESALAEYALMHQPSGEQMAGVKKFLELFVNIGEKDQPQPNFPDKSLDYRKPEPPKKK